MVTVINNPGTTETDRGVGFFLGAILLIALFILFLMYGVPFIGNSFRGGTSIEIPNKIDINLHGIK